MKRLRKVTESEPHSYVKGAISTCILIKVMDNLASVTKRPQLLRVAESHMLRTSFNGTLVNRITTW